MKSVEFDAREASIVMAIGLAIYAVLLTILPLRLITNYDGVCAGLALTALGAFAARHALQSDKGKSVLGRTLAWTKRLPLTSRITSALTLFLIALTFDRFVDDDPAHYRLATFVMPVIIGVILFDIKSAIGIIFASAIAIEYFMIPPINAFTPLSLSDGLDLIVYVGVCVQIALAVERFMARGVPEASPC
jgi:hypothetical protein